MSAFSKKLFDALDKLNEMGQLLLVVNNLSDISETDKREMKALAIKKDPRMLKSLEAFKVDHNIDSLKRKWRVLVNSKDPEKPEIKSDSRLKPFQIVPAMTEKVKKTIQTLQETTNLLSIRETLCLDKKSPKEIAVLLKNTFKSKSNFSLSDFSNLILHVEATSEPWANMKKKTALMSLFEILDENKNNSLHKEEISNNLIILSGGTPVEKISAVFFMYDSEGDGLITYENVLEHQKHAFRLLFLLKPNVKKINQTSESLALATTESIFQEIDGTEHLISENEYLAWYLKSELSELSKSEKISRIQSRLQKKQKILEDLTSTYKKITSKENLQEISTMKSLTGLGKVPLHDAFRTFKQKNTSGYFSRQQFSDISRDLVVKYTRDFQINSEFYSSIYKLFTKFDKDGNGIMDISELFCGLSIVCAGNLGDKIIGIFDSFDESRDGLMQFPEILHYFCVVFKMICGEEIQGAISIDQLAKESARNLFKACGISLEKAISADQLKNWVLRSRVRFL